MFETHTLENTEETLVNVHPEGVCSGRTCAIHKRTNHSMRSFPQHFRGDRGMMERICPHGIGHPDPDDREFQVNLATRRLQAQGPDMYPEGYWRFLAEEEIGIHGCDGCCHA